MLQEILREAFKRCLTNHIYCFFNTFLTYKSNKSFTSFVSIVFKSNVLVYSKTWKLQKSLSLKTLHKRNSVLGLHWLSLVISKTFLHLVFKVHYINVNEFPLTGDTSGVDLLYTNTGNKLTSSNSSSFSSPSFLRHELPLLYEKAHNTNKWFFSGPTNKREGGGVNPLNH